MAHDTLPPGRHPTPAGRELVLPKPPGVIRQFWARHPWWTDSIVAAIYFLPTFFSTLAVFLMYDSKPGWLATLGLLAICVSGAALLFRRYRPWTMLFIIWAMTLVIAPIAEIADAASIPIALYSVAVYRSTRDGWMALAGSAVIGTASIALTAGLYRTDTIPPFGAPVAASSSQFIVIMLFATLIGINIGNRKRYVAALVDRAAQLTRERDQLAQLATAAERARIAREMHDIVSHSLTVMVSLADGSVAAIADNPARSTAAMGQVAETGRHALDDMRRMLGVLVDESPALATGAVPTNPVATGAVATNTMATNPAALKPPPGIDDLASLVDTFRAADLPVRFAATGVPPADPGQQLTVYRIVQESLTNALRYATGASQIDVSTTFTSDLITVRIDDDGRTNPRISHGPGRGLVGMRERIALYAGTLESGPRPGGGWQVSASFVPENGSDVTPTAVLGIHLTAPHRTGDPS